MSRLYNIIYCDFPWPYTDCGHAKLPYASMTEQQISEFDWSEFMEPRRTIRKVKHGGCVIFCWLTGPKMDLQFRCIEEWKRRHGLRYIGISHVWIKTRKDGHAIGASGPRPTVVKPLGEFVACLTNVRSGRPFPLLTQSQVQWLDETDMIDEPCEIRGPRTGHSRKPEVMRNKIVELFGDELSKIELFARERFDGWDGHGNEYPTQ